MPPTRLEHCTKEVEKIDAEHQKKLDELAALPDRIRDAHLQELRRWPRAAGDGLGTLAGRLVGREEKLKREIETLAGKREAYLVVMAEEQTKANEKLTREIATQGAALQETELAGWREGGGKFTELVEFFFNRRIVAPARALEELRHEARRQGLDPDSIPELKAPIEPFPLDAHTWLDQMWAHGADPGNMGRREDANPSPLVEFVPDLRPVDRVRLHGVETVERAFKL